MTKTTSPNHSNGNEPASTAMDQIQVQEKEVFDLVLVDIMGSSSVDLKCVKKNMYDPKVKYAAISYRWGELDEQLLETPDYTAHVTSFDLSDLKTITDYIHSGYDLHDVDYLWVDAISVNQLDHARKKETILKMKQIYQHASYILAIPDLHLGYLRKNTANQEVIRLLSENRDTIYNEIFNMTLSSSSSSSINDSIKKEDIINHQIIDSTLQQQQQRTINDNDYNLAIQELKNKNMIKEVEIIIKKIETLKSEIKELKEKEFNQKKEDIKKVYQFLAYLLNDWSNRAWVISEYHIAKEKYMKYGTPLKYCFASLQSFNQRFFTYHFNDDDQQQQQNKINIKRLNDEDVINVTTLNQFLKEIMMQQSHLDMIIDSRATRNEDRFNAILPSWHEYKHLIDQVSEWNITDMASVKLKLYEIMNDHGDLWDKAKLLHSNNLYHSDNINPILPTFASHYRKNELIIIEKVNRDSPAYQEFENNVLDNINHYKYDDEREDELKQLINEYHANDKPVWIENLKNIQLNRYHCFFLSVQTMAYFIHNKPFYHEVWDDWRQKLSLDENDTFQFVLIPFFTCHLPDCIDFPRTYGYGSNIALAGNKEKNKWIFTYLKSYDFEQDHFCTDNYTFNIY